MWGEVSCLRKQHDGRDRASNHRASDLKSNALTTTPPRPHIMNEIKFEKDNTPRVTVIHIKYHGRQIPKEHVHERYCTSTVRGWNPK